jgi:hypothetical protein
MRTLNSKKQAWHIRIYGLLTLGGISGSHGGRYKDGRLLGRCAVWTGTK